MKGKLFPDYEQFFYKPSNSPENLLEFIWLGQAGFSFRYNNTILIIDPYLSDYLSKKYKETIFPHIRLMDIPIHPENIQNLDFLLSTHPHSDHMDPETIKPLIKSNPIVKIIVPFPAIEEALKRGAPPSTIIGAKSEKIIQINEIIEIIPIPAAHEELKRDEYGNHYYLGYIIRFGNQILYHSGDCVPYEDLSKLLMKYAVNIAFLPINGRDNYRRTNKIAGNFHFFEARDLCQTARISKLVVHHFGMFAYNTVPNEKLVEIERTSNSELEILIPKMFYKYEI